MRRIATATALTVALVAAQIAPAAAAAPITEPFTELLEDRLNPCTGETTDLQTDGWQRIRVQQTPSGRFHLLINLHVTWTSTDGFAGHAKQTTTVMAHDLDSVEHTTLQFVGRDSTGRVVRHREQVNVRYVDDIPVLEIENITSSCHGRG